MDIPPHTHKIQNTSPPPTHHLHISFPFINIPQHKASAPRPRVNARHLPAQPLRLHLSHCSRPVVQDFVATPPRARSLRARCTPHHSPQRRVGGRRPFVVHHSGRHRPTRVGWAVAPAPTPPAALYPPAVCPPAVSRRRCVQLFPSSATTTAVQRAPLPVTLRRPKAAVARTGL